MRAKVGVSETMAVGLGYRRGCGARVYVEAWICRDSGQSGSSGGGLDISC
jgi:hypothetical protein